MKPQPSKFFRLLRVGVAGLLLGAGGAMHAAQAQLIQQDFPTDIPGYEANFDASVLNRMLLQDQSDGIQAGGFNIRPQLTETGGYNSNVLGAPNTGSGEILSQAGLRANSDWASNSLGASLNVQDHRYTDLPSASYTDWTAALGGSIQFGQDSLTLGYSHLAQHLTATDLGLTGVATPVPFSVDDARIGYEKVFGHFSLTPSINFDDFQFGKSGGDIIVNDDSLDHLVETERLAWRYEMAPGEGVVGIFRTSQAQYSNVPGDGYFDGTVFAGLDYTPPAIFQWRALAGFETRRFNASDSQDINIPVFELDGIWTPTELNTITGTAFRQSADPSSPFGRNQTVTEARVEIDHQLRTNVFLKVDGQFGRSLTQSSIADIGNSTDTQLSFGGAAWWNVNRHVSVELSDQLLNSKTTGELAGVSATSPSPDFTSNTILLGFRLYE